MTYPLYHHLLHNSYCFPFIFHFFFSNILKSLGYFSRSYERLEHAVHLVLNGSKLINFTNYFVLLISLRSFPSFFVHFRRSLFLLQSREAGARRPPCPQRLENRSVTYRLLRIPYCFPFISFFLLYSKRFGIIPVAATIGWSTPFTSSSSARKVINDVILVSPLSCLLYQVQESDANLSKKLFSPYDKNSSFGAKSSHGLPHDITFTWFSRMLQLAHDSWQVAFFMKTSWCHVG
jgi:hypothetical protein